MAINHQERNQRLEVLIKDLKCHMLNYDKRHNPVNKNTITLASYFDKLLAVESFITSVLMNKKCLLDLEVTTPLGKKFDKLEIPFLGTNLFHRVFNNKSETFSKYLIGLFEALYTSFDLLYEYEFAEGVRSHPAENEWCLLDELRPKEKETLNFSIDLFRKAVKESSFRKEVNADNTRAAKRYKSVLSYIDELFSEHDKLTFICLDLSFIPAPVIIRLPLGPEQRDGHVLNVMPQKITPENAQALFSKLISNGKNHQSLRELAGYLQKWEYTPEKGIYSRCIFIYPAKAVKDIDTLIESIHNYWNDNITDGKGTIHNAKLSKEPKEFYQTTCTMAAHDTALIEQLKQRVLLYMTHIDLFYKPVELTDFKRLYNRSENKKFTMPPVTGDESN